MPMNTTLVRRLGVESGSRVASRFGPHDLSGDLTRREIRLEPHLAGRAEAAPHRAADLRRDAHRDPIRIAHQDRPRSRVRHRGEGGPCGLSRGRLCAHRGPRSPVATPRPIARGASEGCRSSGRTWRCVSTVATTPVWLGKAGSSQSVSRPASSTRVRSYMVGIGFRVDGVANARGPKARGSRLTLPV